MTRSRITPFVLVLAGTILVCTALTAFASIATYLNQ